MDLRDVSAMRVRLRADRALDLPCLPTVALRSVLGMALRDVSCARPSRRECGGCDVERTCAYRMIFEPAGAVPPRLGVTNRAPAPLVLAPESAVADGSSLHLDRDETLDVRVVLLGPARSLSELVIAALRTGASGGVGKAGHDGERAAMSIESVIAESVVAAAPGTTAVLDLVSPLRLTSGGKIRSRFSAADLLRGLARRVETLTALYDAGSDPSTVPSVDGITLEARDVRVVHVERWSARQRARMELPGVVGTIELRGDLAAWWPWLALGEWVQLGKGTSMGYGRYRLRGEMG